MTGSSRGVRLAQALAAFGGASVASLVLLAQLTPGWRAPPEEPALTPQPAPPASAAPALAWTEEPATVRLSDGRRSAAWVLRPRHDGAKVPGVVLVAGAGTHGRDAMLAQARALAAAGIASISYAKRTPGYSAVSRDYPQLAADAIAASEALAGTPGVDPGRIGLLGFSEGGWVAPVAIQQAPTRFAFLVLVSAPGINQLGWPFLASVAVAVAVYRRGRWLSSASLPAASGSSRPGRSGPAVRGAGSSRRR